MSGVSKMRAGDGLGGKGEEERGGTGRPGKNRGKREVGEKNAIKQARG